MKTQNLNKLISLFFLAALIIGLCIWFYLLRIGYFEDKLKFLDEENQTPIVETMGFEHLNISPKSEFVIGSDYEFTGWYKTNKSTEECELVSDDIHYSDTIFLHKMYKNKYNDSVRVRMGASDITTGWGSEKVVISPNANTGGTVTGSGTYDVGTMVSIKAFPYKDYEFIGWLENGILICTDTVYVFKAEKSRRIIGDFKYKK